MYKADLRISTFYFGLKVSFCHSSITHLGANLTMLMQQGMRQSIGVFLYATGSDIERKISQKTYWD